MPVFILFNTKPTYYFSRASNSRSRCVCGACVREASAWLECHSGQGQVGLVCGDTWATRVAYHNPRGVDHAREGGGTFTGERVRSACST